MTTASPKSMSGLASTSEAPATRAPAWRFFAAMLLQSALIVAVPFQSALTYRRGETVTLQTAPVDPYDLLRGYSQTLSFAISDADTLAVLPGGRSIFTRENRGELIYVTLSDPMEYVDPTLSMQSAPEAWMPVAVSLERPAALADGQVVIEGQYDGRRVKYGLETYYMPEDQRNDINDHIRKVQSQNADGFVVNIKVDDKGNSVPVSLWVSNREYRF